MIETAEDLAALGSEWRETPYTAEEVAAHQAAPAPPPAEDEEPPPPRSRR